MVRFSNSASSLSLLSNPDQLPPAAVSVQNLSISEQILAATRFIPKT